MPEEEQQRELERISRREFLKNAGSVVCGAAISSTAFLVACVPKEGASAKTVTETIPRFVCPSCGQEFGSLATLKTHYKYAHPSEIVNVNEELTTLIVNGEKYGIKVATNWTLNFVLREKLGLTGVKIWCEEGACGVCTVLVDGLPTFSCMTLAIECEGKNIETIEGLSDGVNLNHIQQAFIDHFGFQCGYCTPGIILVTKALLREHPNPTEEDIREALAGNICKCGDYRQIIASVQAAAVK